MAARAKKAATATAPRHNHEHDYSALLSGVQDSFAGALASGDPLFMTDAAGLNGIYLDNLPAERQVHNCSACRRFMERFGGIAAVTAEGAVVPAMWNPATVPDFYRAAFAAMFMRVARGRVTSPFRSSKPVWGAPETGKWRHMAAFPPASLLHRDRALTAGQAMAAARENFRTVKTALADFTAPMLDEALRLLQAEALARSERFIGPVRWLRTLHDRPKGKVGENVLWRAIATAPEGYCHPRASVVGSLLEDIAAGLPFAEIKARFDAKLGPLVYQRPQAAPSAGNIKAAEALVEKLGIARSLERRFARLDEVKTIWTPRAEKPAAPIGGGVFAHLKPKDGAGIRPIDMPAVTVTWDKFARIVLPSAERIELHVPHSGRFIAMTTAVHADAPPILKWDRDDERNPVAWYVYHRGSSASQWRLTGGAWATVNAVVPAPNMWGSRPQPHLSEGLVLVLDGAADTRDDAGNALFPECLRDDLHGIRATVEAYSRTARIAGREEASACGYSIHKGAADCLLRTRSGASWSTYRIDRWD